MARVLVLAPDGSRSSREAVNSGCMRAMIRALEGAPGIESCRRTTACDLQNGQLDAADVLLLGGGEAVKMRDLLKPVAPNIRAWLQSGGRGLVGICAGAVVASSDSKRGLQLTMGVRLREDNLCAVAGLEGAALLEPCGPMGAWLFPTGGIRFCYENGPLLQPHGCHAEAWALYGSDFVPDSPRETNRCHDSPDDNGAGHQRSHAKRAWHCSTCGTLNSNGRKKCSDCGEKLHAQKKQLRLQERLAQRMPGCAAVVGTVDADSGPCNSRTVLFGPHPEFSSSAGGWTVLQNAVLWSCGKEHIAINQYIAATPKSQQDAPEAKKNKCKRPDFDVFLTQWTKANSSAVGEFLEAGEQAEKDQCSKLCSEI